MSSNVACIRLLIKTETLSTETRKDRYDNIHKYNTITTHFANPTRKYFRRISAWTLTSSAFVFRHIMGDTALRPLRRTGSQARPRVSSETQAIDGTRLFAKT